MNREPDRTAMIGQTVVGIAHTPYSKPEFIVQGIGPASFRGHFVTLGNGITLDLFTAEITIASLPVESMAGETEGISFAQIIGRRIVEVVHDHVASSLIILEGGIFLKDDNDAFYGNPLRAGLLFDHYSPAEIAMFADYWSGQPAMCSKAT
jgi:hypothetical protein